MTTLFKDLPIGAWFITANEGKPWHSPPYRINIKKDKYNYCCLSWEDLRTLQNMDPSVEVFQLEKPPCLSLILG